MNRLVSVFMMSRYIIVIFFLFFTCTHELNGNLNSKKFREQIESLQLEMVKATIEFSNTLKKSTGRDLQVIASIVTF